MRSLAVLTLTLLVHSTCCESGAEPDGLLEDTELETPEYDCFMKLGFLFGDHKLTCSLKDSDAGHSNISFEVCCKFFKSCKKLKQEKMKYALHSDKLMLPFECQICIQLQRKKQQCTTYEFKSIVKPDAPINISITYQTKGKEYIIEYKIKPGLLTNKLFYQIALREEHGKWENLEDVKIGQFRLLEQNLKQGVKYEMKVRSKPDGNYYRGIWSDWSDSGYFETRRDDPSYDDELQLMIIIISSVGVLLITVLVCMVLWEKRLKPYVWPHIPDHKSTLEKLCKKQRKNLEISFNPDYFVDVDIHKVDGIQAKTQEHSLLDPSEILEEDLAGESPSRPHLQMTLGSMSEKALAHPTVLANNQPVVLHKVFPVGSSNVNGYALDSSALQEHGESSSNVAQDYENSTTQTHAVNAACQKEAYVTMSAFPAASIPR